MISREGASGWKVRPSGPCLSMSLGFKSQFHLPRFQCYKNNHRVRPTPKSHGSQTIREDCQTPTRREPPPRLASTVQLEHKSTCLQRRWHSSNNDEIALLEVNMILQWKQASRLRRSSLTPRGSSHSAAVLCLYKSAIMRWRVPRSELKSGELLQHGFTKGGQVSSCILRGAYICVLWVDDLASGRAK